MKRLILVAVLSLAASLAVAAPAADAPKPDATPAAAEGKDKLVCVRERTTGSNRVKRVCRTAEQMANDSAETRQALIRGHGREAVEGL